MRIVTGRLALLAAALVLVAFGATCAPAPTPAPTSSSPTLAAPTATATPVLSPTLRPTLTPTPLPSGVHCGTERWPVKTLSDQDAGRVNFQPVPAIVAQVRAIPAPASLPQASRVAPVELTVYAVTARLVEFKREDDRDIHVVIADPSDPSLTMIVEFPDASNCAGAVASAHAGEMRAARAALVAAFGEPSASAFTSLSGTGTFTGVGFFDVIHGQRGVAPNGIELHPVLAFRSAGGQALPPSGTSSAPTVAPRGLTYPCEATDCDCRDFASHAEAQRVFEKHGGSPANNWSGLDRDHDGAACEALP